LYARAYRAENGAAVGVSWKLDKQAKELARKKRREKREQQ